MDNNNININNDNLLKNLVKDEKTQDKDNKKEEYVKTYKVDIYIYDLSNGMAKSMSPFLLGKTIDAIYHTGLVVYGTEYYFGGGICRGFPAVS